MTQDIVCQNGLIITLKRYTDIVQRLGQLVTRATHKKNIHTQNNLKKQLTFRSY